jgi:hypothetical protein
MSSNLETAKKRINYSCEICDYNTSNKMDYTRHLDTIKHKNAQLATFSNQNSQKNAKMSATPFVCPCGKTYKDNSGLWRHKKKCDTKSKEEPTEKELIMTLIKQNTELQDKVIELCKNGIIHNTVNTNSHNKTFNLQFFLNETCKDAINIMDFVKSITLQLSDLENVGRMGYVEGISNIITNKLNLLEENKRPIHCTDAKRETLYVKDENKWERESEEKPTIRKVIHTVANKNIQMVPVFKEKHPDYGQGDSNTSDQYQQIMYESMGGDGDEIEQENRIIKNISKEVIVQKSSQT